MSYLIDAATVAGFAIFAVGAVLAFGFVMFKIIDLIVKVTRTYMLLMAAASLIVRDRDRVHAERDRIEDARARLKDDDPTRGL